jgi:nitroreductase
MPAETQTDPVKSLEWRYATKKFDPAKKIDAQTWAKIEQSLVLSPSSFGLQPWKFVVITDEKVKQQLQPISYNQRQPVDCSHLVVLARKSALDADYIEKYMELTAKVKQVPIETLDMLKGMQLNFVKSTPPEQLKAWQANQVYIALGVLLSAAAALGVDSCPMEGLDKEAYDKLLGLPERGCHAVVMCALGYRAADDKYAALAKVRFPESELIIRV